MDHDKIEAGVRLILEGIGEDPQRIQHLWQKLYRGAFYPAGHEKLHALGALDLALWDLKGKQLGAPLYALLGGLTREYVECYSTGYPWQGSLAETARACLSAGFRAFRTAVGDAPDGIFDARRQVEQTAEACRTLREAITALRMEGQPICGHPNTGYYLAGSAADISSTCAFLRSRAMTSLVQEARLKKISLPNLLGQMLIDYDGNKAA